MIKPKRGFTIAEAIISFAVIMLVAAVCIQTCMAAAEASQRNYDKVSAITASSEFITCFKNTEDTSGSDNFLNAFNKRLLMSLDIAAATDYTISGNKFMGNAQSVTLTYGIRSLQIILSGGGASYIFISKGYIKVNAAVALDSTPFSITVTGYAEGVTSAICAYDYVSAG